MRENRETNQKQEMEPASDDREGRWTAAKAEASLEEKTEKETGGEPKEKKKGKAKGAIARKKCVLALTLALCMILTAVGTGKLVKMENTTDALSIRLDDWLEQRPYADSITLAVHARSDLDAVLRYVKLKQALEETDGSLDLTRPILAAVLMDHSIAVYTMQDMLEMGDEMGIYVYEGMTDRETGPVYATDDVQIQAILWSIYDYETDSLNTDTISFLYGEEDPWDIRMEQMEEAIYAAETIMAEDPDIYWFSYVIPQEYDSSTAEGNQAATETYGNTEESLVSYEVISKQPILLSEYCIRFLTNYLQPYYIWKGQFSSEESSLHWKLQLEKDGASLIYGDPVSLREDITEDQLDAIYRCDSQTKAVISTFHQDVDMISWGNVKSSLIFDYDEYTFYFGLRTENLEKEQDTYGQQAFSYSQYRKQAVMYGILMGTSLLVFLIAFVWLTVLSGRRDGDAGIALNFYDRLPTEIGLSGVCCLIWLTVWDCYLGIQIVSAIHYDYGESPLYYYIAFAGCLAGLVILCGLLLWLGWYGLVRRCKAHTIWRNSLVRYALLLLIGLARRSWGWICRLIHSVVDAFNKVGDRWWKTLGLFGLYLAGNLFFLLFLVSVGDPIVPMLLLMAWNGAAAFLLLRKTAQRRQVQNGIDRIASGDIDYQLPVEGLTGDSYEMAAAINSIRGGLKNAVEEKVKNERMRAELITNVSHDIKTPLTSIINYVDLLKRENINDPKVQEYLNILEKKAERLRILTEDLVEASKASSGVLKLNEEEIDFVELVNQTNGEFADRFGRCNLKLICSMPDHPVYILADGRYVWRILENLYRNVEKYALTGTRVYVEVAEKGNRICFVIKNISASELNIQAEELTERFIRGDASRTTEGSGLGLSIARDLTKLMNGTFQIYLDGDLFRVTISFQIHE